MEKKLSSSLFNGIVFFEFTPHLFENKEISFSFPPLSCKIPAGNICLLRAPSGRGKTVFLLTIAHLLEHTGELLFIEDKKEVNAHTLSRDEFQKKIFFIREENIRKGTRMIDIFTRIVRQKLRLLHQEMYQEFGTTLTHLAWNVPDNLLEYQIQLLNNDQRSVFPISMVDILKKLRKERTLYVNELLSKQKGNISASHIHAERSFVSLSAGEKSRIFCLLAHETTFVNESLRLLIFDEPFAHLDQENCDYQLETIQKITKSPIPPAILLVSHQYVSKVRNTIPHSFELSLF